MTHPTKKNQAHSGKQLPPSFVANPSAWPLSWSGEKTLVDYGSSFLRERDIGPREFRHQQMVASLRLVANAR